MDGILESLSIGLGLGWWEGVVISTEILKVRVFFLLVVVIVLWLRVVFVF